MSIDSSLISHIFPHQNHAGFPVWFSTWLSKFQSDDGGNPMTYGLAISQQLPARNSGVSNGVERKIISVTPIDVYEADTIQSNTELDQWLRYILSLEKVSFSSNVWGKQALSAISGCVIVDCPANEQSIVNIESQYDSGVDSDLIVIRARQESTVVIVEQNRTHFDAVIGRTIILVAESNATLTYIHEGSIGGNTVVRRVVGIAESHAQITSIDAGWSETQLTKSDSSIYLIGSRARATLNRAIIATSLSANDCFDEVVHLGDDTVGNIRAVGVVGKKSKLIYRGLVDARKGISGMNGQQQGKFLALDRTAEIDAIPALDIIGNEVASVHKLSIAYLSDTELFALRSRGLTRSEASFMVVQGMMATISQSIEDSHYMNRVQEYHEQALERMFADITDTP